MRARMPSKPDHFWPVLAGQLVRIRGFEDWTEGQEMILLRVTTPGLCPTVRHERYQPCQPFVP